MLFLITCDYGTRQWALGRRAALEWLACCGPVAEVRDVFGRVVARRVQGV